MIEIDEKQMLLAANAAGYEIRSNSEEGGTVYRKGPCEMWVEWSPLTNKSDSFDLMVAIHRNGNQAPRRWEDLSEELQNAWIDLDAGIHGGDAAEAMLAIFRCAVEIGRAKEGKANAQN